MKVAYYTMPRHKSRGGQVPGVFFSEISYNQISPANLPRKGDFRRP